MVKLDLGCGPNKKEGFIGVDVKEFKGVDIILDLVAKRKQAVIYTTPSGEEFEWEKIGTFIPWTWENSSVDEVHSSHFIEHLTSEERIHFFNELYRVLKPQAKALIIVPYWKSGRAYGDLTHKWPPVVEMSFLYINKAWREANAPHVPFTCDFDSSWVQSFGPPWSFRSAEAQAFAINHYMEVALDLHVTLTKRG